MTHTVYKIEFETVRNAPQYNVKCGHLIMIVENIKNDLTNVHSTIEYLSSTEKVEV